MRSYKDGVQLASCDYRIHWPIDLDLLGGEIVVAHKGLHVIPVTDDLIEGSGGGELEECTHEAIIDDHVIPEVSHRHSGLVR